MQHPTFPVEYVLGFAFTPSKGGVLLIRKNRPAWQAGKFNGVGGKIESTDPTVEDAMCREFYEETGIPTQESQWSLFAQHVKDTPDGYHLHVLSTVLTEAQCQQSAMTTDEEPVWHTVTFHHDPDLVSGTRMYIEMALNHFGKPFHTMTIETP
jgi:8-oxo-dGTP pyrophosphatase MutT (NUDIX family)